MRKVFLMFIALFASFSIMAQESNYPTKNNVEVNEFWSNWFLSVDGGAQVGFNGKTFVWNSVTPTASVSLGKWVTPVVGLRAQVNAGHYSTLAKCDYSVNRQLGGSLFGDLMFNLSQACGYKDNVVWNFIPYVGYGRVATEDDYKNFGAWAWNFGFDNQFRVSKKAKVDFEVFTRRFNGHGVAGKHTNGRDWNVGAQVGLVVELGKNKWDKAADVDAINEMHNAQVAVLNDLVRKAYLEKEAALKAAAAVPDTIVVVEKVEVEVPGSYSVFFSADSYRLESRKDLVNLQNFVDFAMAEDAKTVVVTGYADSKTGSVDYNQELSEKRAETIKNALVEAGLPEERVVVKALGGVYELNPYNYNRRVVVSVE